MGRVCVSDQAAAADREAMPRPGSREEKIPAEECCASKLEGASIGWKLAKDSEKDHGRFSSWAAKQR